MQHEYTLIESIEPLMPPPVNGAHITRTRRTFVLLTGDTTYSAFFGASCDEIAADYNPNVRMGGERFYERWNAGDGDLAPFLRSVKKSIKAKNISPGKAPVYARKQFLIKCGELNARAMIQVQGELTGLLSLTDDIANNSENRAQIWFLRNVLRAFAEWYKAAKITPPVETRLLLEKRDADSPKVALPKNKKIDQDDFTEKFLAQCQELGVERGKTIKAKLLYRIGKKMYGRAMPPEEEFKDGQSMYRKLRTYASIAGFSKHRKQ